MEINGSVAILIGAIATTVLAFVTYCFIILNYYTKTSIKEKRNTKNDKKKIPSDNARRIQ